MAAGQRNGSPCGRLGSGRATRNGRSWWTRTSRAARCGGGAGSTSGDGSCWRSRAIGWASRRGRIRASRASRGRSPTSRAREPVAGL